MSLTHMGSPGSKSIPSPNLHSGGELTGASAYEFTTHHENGENTTMPPGNVGHGNDTDTSQMVSMDDEESLAAQDADEHAIPVKRKHAELDPEGRTEQNNDENADEEKRKKRKTDKVVLEAFEHAFVATMEGQGLSMSPASSGPNQIQTASIGESTCLTKQAAVSNNEIPKPEGATTSRPAFYIGARRIVAEKSPQNTETREKTCHMSGKTPPTTSSPEFPAFHMSMADATKKSEPVQQNSAVRPSSGPPSRPPSQAPVWPSPLQNSRPPSQTPSSNSSTHNQQLPPMPQTSSTFGATYRSPFEAQQASGPTVPMGTVIPAPLRSHVRGGAQGPSNVNLKTVQSPIHSQQVNGRAPPYMNQQQPMVMSHQPPPPRTSLQHPQFIQPPRHTAINPVNTNGPFILPSPHFFHALGLEFSSMSSMVNPPGVRRSSVPLTQTKAAVKEERTTAQDNNTAGAASAATVAQRSPHPLQNAPSPSNQVQNNNTPARQSRSIEAGTDLLVQLLGSAAYKPVAVEQQNNGEDWRWVERLRKKELELEAERAELKKAVDKERAQWQKERRVWAEETGHNSRQIEVGKQTLLRREAEFREEQALWRIERYAWEQEKARSSGDISWAQQEISMLRERVASFEEEQAQWDRKREMLEGDKAINLQQIDQLSQQISQLMQKEAKIEEERVQWEKERDAWKGETARIMKLFELAEQQISQCLEKEKKSAEERSRWGKEREALDAETARKSEETSQLQKCVKVLYEKLSHSLVAKQTNGTEAKGAVEQPQERRDRAPSTSNVKATESNSTQEQESTTRKLAERIISKHDFLARITDTATERITELEERTEKLREQNAELTANAQRNSRIIATYILKAKEFHTITKVAKSTNEPSSLLAAKDAEQQVRIARMELEKIVAASAAKDSVPRPRVSVGVEVQKPQPKGSKVPAKATEK